MKIETRWNIGDTPWVILRHHMPTHIRCKACNGEGGANIPNTQVWVTCQKCDGECGEPVTTWNYDVTEGRISRITTTTECVLTDRGVETKICYSGYYRSAVRPTGFAAVFLTEEEALAEAERMKIRDIKQGELLWPPDDHIYIERD